MIISQQQRAFLSRRPVGRLGTASGDGFPHVVPVCFALAGDTVFIPIDEKKKTGDPRLLKRLRNIMENEKVCLLVDRYSEDWAELGWVMLRGKARVEMVAAEVHTAVQLLRVRYHQYADMDLESRPIIVIDVDLCTHWGDLTR
ncbi:MAG: TIGR03668 family PPOX class F420-dependent oxidoreductase [Minwuia sp.]|nr:TIGR03668 family PPOX class F420-dependent oxidoreductase [Minwuia sp.]